MQLDDIQEAVRRLSKDELGEFATWLDELIAERWDAEIEKDIRAGRFEAAGRRATADFEAGRCQPL